MNEEMTLQDVERILQEMKAYIKRLEAVVIDQQKVIDTAIDTIYKML